MSKTKNMVIDQQNKERENNQSVNPRQRDQRRLSIETLTALNRAAHDAMKEIQGDRQTAEVVCDSELYGELFQMSVLGYNRWLDYERKKQQYRDMKMHDLLKELYLRMHSFYHYSEAKGAQLPGIATRMEQNGVFALMLGECALNLEHSFDDRDSYEREGRLFCIGLNLPLLETEDPDDENSHFWSEYDEFLSFCCEFRDGSDVECHDVYPSEYSHEDVIRSILAQLDQISELANENKQ